MYRPEGMKENPHLEFTGEYGAHYKECEPGYSAFEAGADAMLEGLINQPSNRGANVLHVDIEADGSTIRHNPHRKGYLVFIPEESIDV